MPQPQPLLPQPFAHPFSYVFPSQHGFRARNEEVCSHFCDGVDVAREDRLASKGIPTSRLFRKDQRVRLPLIQAAAAVSADFGQVQSIVPAGPEAVRITGENGQAVTCPINWQFLMIGIRFCPVSAARARGIVAGRAKKSAPSASSAIRANCRHSSVLRKASSGQ